MSGGRKNGAGICFVREENSKKERRALRPSHRKSHSPVRPFLAAIFAVCVIFLFLSIFHVKRIDVSGINYCTKEEILNWLEKEKGTVNSLYTLVRVNTMKFGFPPAVEAIRASIKEPWHLSLAVTEKEIAGYLDYQGKALCFGPEGTATLFLPKSPVKGEGIFVEGLNVIASKVRLGESLPVSDSQAFHDILQVSRLLKKYDLSPAKIICRGSSLKLIFPFGEALLGDSSYEKRIAQLPPIMKKLSEDYPEVKGTLHLENFGEGEETARFVPERGDEAE